MAALIHFQSDEIEALQMALSHRDLDARRAEALRRARWKLDQPARKTYGKPKSKPADDPEYARWIRSLPCLICQATRGIEGAHTGPHGIGIKSPPRSRVPLCRACHRTGNQSYHRLGPRAFERAHGVNLDAEVARLNAEYEDAENGS